MKNKFLNVIFIFLTISNTFFFIIALLFYLSQKDKQTKIEIRNQLLMIYAVFLDLTTIGIVIAGIITGRVLLLTLMPVLLLVIIILTVIILVSIKNRRLTSDNMNLSTVDNADNNDKVIDITDNLSIHDIVVPKEYIKRTTLGKNIFYDRLLIYDNKIVGFYNNKKIMTWYFKSYIGIDFIEANINSQFAQIVFLTGFNSNNRAIGIDFSSTQNRIAMNDTNRILFCSGMLSFDKTNAFAEKINDTIKKTFENFQENHTEQTDNISLILKYQELLEKKIITQEEFETKKKQLLN